MSSSLDNDDDVTLSIPSLTSTTTTIDENTEPSTPPNLETDSDHLIIGEEDAEPSQDESNVPDAETNSTSINWDDMNILPELDFSNPVVEEVWDTVMSFMRTNGEAFVFPESFMAFRGVRQIIHIIARHLGLRYELVEYSDRDYVVLYRDPQNSSYWE